MNCSKVLKITDKRCKDGLESGTRINAMIKFKIELKPSYVKIEGFKLHVTYCSQQITCIYCGN